jgi:hypothetical protein
MKRPDDDVLLRDMADYARMAVTAHNILWEIVASDLPALLRLLES